MENKFFFQEILKHEITQKNDIQKIFFLKRIKPYFKSENFINIFFKFPKKMFRTNLRLQKQAFLNSKLLFSQSTFQPRARGVMTSIHSKDEEPGFLQMVKNYFDQAGRYTNVSKDVLEVYKNCDRVIKINLPLVRENGKIEYITSYRAQHKHHRYLLNDFISI